jgi:hypothetical protein
MMLPHKVLILFLPSAYVTARLQFILHIGAILAVVVSGSFLRIYLTSPLVAVHLFYFFLLSDLQMFHCIHNAHRSSFHCIYHSFIHRHIFYVYFSVSSRSAAVPFTFVLYSTYAHIIT